MGTQTMIDAVPTYSSNCQFLQYEEEKKSGGQENRISTVVLNEGMNDSKAMNPLTGDLLSVTPHQTFHGFTQTPVQQQTLLPQQNSLLSGQNTLPLASPSTTTTTHNLIPTPYQHYNNINIAPQAHQHVETKTPTPTLIPPGYVATGGIPLPSHPIMTVQDHPMINPVYNGVNPQYPGLRVLNQSPPVFAVENFLSPVECDFLISIAQDCFSPAPVVGKGAGEVSPSRTSSTCYLAREDLPEYLKKIVLLTGKPLEHCELPQVGRYFPTQQYLQHFDAFDLSNEDGRRFASNGGQRTVTVLVYLNDVNVGGSTSFPALNLEVQPRKGMALVFFPATVDGLLDKMALHAALPAVDTKYVSQVWIRQGKYEGVPSKRIFSSMEQASIVQKSLIATASGISPVDLYNNPTEVNNQVPWSASLPLDPQQTQNQQL